MTAPNRPVRLDVDWQAIAANVRALRRAYGPEVRMIAPVKANGYGHGALGAAKTVLANGADALAVAMADEAVQLREAGVGAPILILGASVGGAVDEAVRHEVAMAVQDAAQIDECRAAARRLGKPALVHIQIDTGMSRLGTRGSEELRTLLEQIGTDGLIRVEGAFTHYFAGRDREICQGQHARFAQAVGQIRRAGHRPLAHSAATEASLLWPELRDEGVRPGLAIYGGCADLLPELKWAMRLWAKPVRVARIEPGETAGYGPAFCAQRPTTVMTVPIGYADGYPRAIGGRGFALVRGRRAPVIGRVCMDMLLLDVTDVPGACMQDEVVLLGEQGGEAIRPDEMAQWADTISYEIITGFHDRIARGDFDDKGTDKGDDTQ
ncbi:MAG: alanine racemase [Eubacteriales bacterium]|nr:alanine racemase [Eubacteriales bacterium]